MSLTTKLNPPQVGNKLPAFAYLSGGSILTVPFNLNRSVGRNQFQSVAIIVKAVQTNVEKFLGTTKDIVYNHKTHNYEARFNFGTTFIPQIGQYYKVQIAFVDDVTDSANPVIGYYSTASVVKCTAKPTIYIKDRDNTVNHTYEYTGVYSQLNGDVTEKVYSYCFTLYDENNNVVATSGEQIHNSANDNEIYESSDTWVVHKTLDTNVNYEIGYTVTTMNGYVVDEVRYPIIDAETVLPNVHATLEVQNDFVDGYIRVWLQGDGKPVRVSGSFVLLRSSSENNYDSWYELTRFQLSQWDATTSREICKDYTVQQGFEYKYAIQAYNSAGLYSDRMITKPVLCDFEDAFLYDGERQLKIRFNPKISSFKSTILETKTDTIGGKFPFVFRNGNVEYKEFAISGMLSLLGDENDEFLTGLPREMVERRTSPAAPDYVPGMDSWLTADNYRRERQFKMIALTWLTNGKPKLFRSPAEGNFIVRLMNTSLSPNDTLGRMLHTFSTTAYEIAECNFENLQHYGFTVEPYVEARTLKINQINLNNVPSNMQNEDGSIILPSAYLASISANPDVDFTYTLSNSGSGYFGCTNLTGTFVFPESVLSESPLTSIKLTSDSWGDSAFITYGYYDTTVDTFSYINKITITDKIIQHGGLGLYLYENGEIQYDYTEGKNPVPKLSAIKNIIPLLEDFRIQTGAFHYVRVKTKAIQEVYYDKGQWWFDRSSQVTSWNPSCLYKYGNKYVIDGSTPPIAVAGGLYLEPDPQNDDTFIDTTKEADLYLFKLNDSDVIDFSGNESTDGRYDALTNLSSIKELYAGRGLILDLVYQEKEILYTVESENDAIKEAKETWLRYKDIYETNRVAGRNVEADKNRMDAAYSIYLKLLEVYANQMKEEYNIEYAI